MVLTGERSITYPAHDLAAAPTLADHIPCALSDLPPRHTARLPIALAQQTQHRLHAVGKNGPPAEHLRHGLDVLILAAKGLPHELVSEGR